MLILMRVLLVVYVLAINAYGFLLLKFQKDGDELGDCENKVHDGKLFITALLGGALGIFVAVFVLKYRMKSMFFMVLMPVVAVLNAYLIFLCFSSDGFFYGGRYVGELSAFPRNLTIDLSKAVSGGDIRTLFNYILTQF